MAGFAVALLAGALPACAAELSVAPPGAPGVGDQFLVPITLDTEGESINAIEGNLSYPSSTLTLREIRRGNSLISIWLEEPKELNGSIRFAGITPGGFAGSSEELFTLVFEAKSAGSARISFENGHAYLNDGDGTETKLSLAPSVFSIGAKGSGTRVAPLAESDSYPPSSFQPTLGRDPSIQDGQWFVAFTTNDKSSGIDHYEVAESEWGTLPFTSLTWTRAESPFVLSDQSLHSFVYVKAVDRAGNERIESLSPTHPSILYTTSVGLVILITLLLLVYFGRIYARIARKKGKARRRTA